MKLFLYIFLSFLFVYKIYSKEFNSDFQDLNSYYYTKQARNDFVQNLPHTTSSHKSKHFSGYIEIEPNVYWHYIYIESENDPLNSPLMFWSNGGPGCSGLLGLFNEHGPWRPIPGPKLVRNEYTWTRLANIVYIEAPEGVGFSNTNNLKNKDIYTDYSTSMSFLIFFNKFFLRYPYLIGIFSNNSNFNINSSINYTLGNLYNSLTFSPPSIFLSSESYGGHYIPQWSLLLLESLKEIRLHQKKITILNNNQPFDKDILTKNNNLFNLINSTLSNELNSIDFNDNNIETFFKNNYLSIMNITLSNFDGFLLGNPYVSFETSMAAEVEALWGHQLIPLPIYKIWRDSKCYNNENFYFANFNKEEHIKNDNEIFGYFEQNADFSRLVHRDNNNLSTIKKNIYEYNKKNSNKIRKNNKKVDNKHKVNEGLNLFPGFNLDPLIQKHWDNKLIYNNTAQGDVACLALLYSVQMYSPNINPYAIDHDICLISKGENNMNKFLTPQQHALKNKFFNSLNEKLDTNHFTHHYKSFMNTKVENFKAFNSNSQSEIYNSTNIDPRAKLYDPCIMNQLLDYLNSEEVQYELHIQTFNNDSIVWKECNNEINSNWAGGDFFSSTINLYSKIFNHEYLSPNFHGAIFSGDNDGVVPTQGSQNWIHTLNFTYDLMFEPWFQPEDLLSNICQNFTQPIDSYKNNITDTNDYSKCNPPFITHKKEPFGFVTNFLHKKFALVTIRFSGHESPLYQPDRAYALIHNFINKKFYSTNYKTLNYLDIETDYYKETPNKNIHYLAYFIVSSSVLFVLIMNVNQAFNLNPEAFSASNNVSDNKKTFSPSNPSTSKTLPKSHNKSKNRVKFSQIEFIKLPMADDEESDDEFVI